VAIVCERNCGNNENEENINEMKIIGRKCEARKSIMKMKGIMKLKANNQSMKAKKIIKTIVKANGENDYEKKIGG